MFLFRRPIPPLLLLLTASAHAEQALQLSGELTAAPAITFDAAPPVVPLLPDPSREVKDDLPPSPTIDLTTPPDDLWQRMRRAGGDVKGGGRSTTPESVIRVWDDRCPAWSRRSEVGNLCVVTVG